MEKLGKEMESVERSVREVGALLKAVDDMIGCVSIKAGHEQFNASVILIEVALQKAKELDDLVAKAFSTYSRINDEIQEKQCLDDNYIVE